MNQLNNGISTPTTNPQSKQTRDAYTSPTLTPHPVLTKTHKDSFNPVEQSTFLGPS